MIDNLTIVIPFRDDPAGLTRLLPTLPAGIPVIVVNDMSREVPPIKRAGATVISMKQRGYFSGAVNAGIQACKTDVLVLNQDIWFTDNRWVDAIGGNRGKYALIGDGVFGHPAWPMGYVQGTFMFMRRDAITRVGLLNGRDWPLWGATADWQVRACRAGFRAMPATGHEWFHHEKRDGSRFGAAITQALADEPGKKAQFIRTPPLVSVVIPCFNYGRYLPDVLGSLMGGKTVLGNVAGQTFTAWEAIIVDDASTDGETQRMGEAFADPWKGIRYTRHAVNQGCPAAINTGIEAAHARATMVVSADDMLDPAALESCYRALEANPNALVYTDQQVFDEKGRGAYRKMPDYDFETLLVKNHVPAGTMYMKEGWRKAGGYPIAMRWGREDWAFAVAMGRAGYCGTRIPQALYLYRRAGQSRTLRNSGPEWRKLFVGQMHELFPDLYRGERPMGCCGGGKRNVAPLPSGGARGAAPMRVGEVGMLLVEYIGDNVGRSTYKGAVTGQRYEFSGQRRVGYVDKRDVAGLLAERYSKRAQFRMAPAPAAKPPAPEVPDAEPEPPEQAAAESVALQSGLTQGVYLALKPAKRAGSPGRRGRKANAA